MPGVSYAGLRTLKKISIVLKRYTAFARILKTISMWNGTL